MKTESNAAHRISDTSNNLSPARRRAASILSVLVVAVVLSACGKAENGPQADASGVTEPALPSPANTLLTGSNGHAKYSWIKANILESKCMDCHSKNQGDGDGLDSANFDSFEGVRKVITPGQPSKSKLYVAVFTKKMPKGMDAMPGMPAKPGVPLNKSELQAISDWIKSGAPNN